MILHSHLPRTALLTMAIAALCATSLGGCNKDKAAATQVAARVNDEEISVHQINGILAKIPSVPPEAAASVRREVLDKLIDQQLAVQQAVDKKLDRTPDVMTAIEAAKRDILARAYLEQLAAAQAKPSADEAKKYYAEHPQLFAQRRVYQLQEITLPAEGAPVDKLKELAAAKPIEQIAESLKQQNIKFSANAVVRPAEQVPLDILVRLHEMKDGQIGVFASGPSVSVLRIAASQPAPVDEATALPRIQQFLANQRASEAVAAELKNLKAKARIEYIGEFAQAGTRASAATPAAAPAPAAPARPTAAALTQSNIDKGVSGLK